MEEERILSADTEIAESSEIVEESYQARRYVLTLNNPAENGFESDDAMIDYIQNLEHFKYAMFHIFILP